MWPSVADNQAPFSVWRVEPISPETDLCERYEKLSLLLVWINPSMLAIAFELGRQQQLQQWALKTQL